MKNTIICKKCGEEIEITEALTHQIEEDLMHKLTDEHKKELDKEIKETEEKVQLKLTRDFALKLETTQKEASEEKERNKELLEQLKSLNDELRALRRKDEERELEMKKQLAHEEEAIREKAAKDAMEKSQSQMAELQKQLEDTKKALASADYKLSQKSQQLQGEVLELNIERMLGDAFLDDEVNAVGKGVQGADIVQKVKGKSGRIAGTILWETKRAKWTPSWLPKLREDGRSEGASVCILVSTNLPKEIADFQLMEGVIVCSDKYVLPLASIVRRSILQIAVAKQTAEAKDENLKLLYDYIQSDTFRHHFEAFSEGVLEMQNDLEYEKRAMERVWKKREIQIKKALMNASRMYGELQGVMGNALPDIKTFALPDREISGE